MDVGTAEKKDCLESLRRSLAERFDDRAAVREQHGKDWSRLPAALPDAVVFAESEEDVRVVLETCQEFAVPVVAQGHQSSLEGHILPVQGGVVLNMTRMNQILRVNEDDFDAVVQPGVTRKQLNLHVRDKGLFFPVDPGADATLGGMASTRASGTNAVRYGTMREAVTAARIVLPGGRVVQAGSRARKSSSGYDLVRLFVGSEGTLGIFTELTVRLHPIPEAVSVGICPFETVAGAIAAVVDAMRYGLRVARMEFMDALSIEMANSYSALGLRVAPTLFVEFDGSPAEVTASSEVFGEIVAQHGGIDFSWSQDPAQRNRLWQARHESLYATNAWRPNAEVWRTDVCVPISRLADSILAAQADIEASGIAAKILGHVGDGNFHVAYLIDPNDSAQRDGVRGMIERLNLRAISYGGTVSGEQGIGILKLPYLIGEHGEPAIETMALIKNAIDPKGIMNPGKMGSDVGMFAALQAAKGEAAS
ncbi:FAD-binding oxidoreductase [Tardiphaga sp. 42S5]|uniref:FAD-binding oxidoreductase n=1 Tax=Tardiphaga sp. 42S5 TaxID=1404799 RepID=UPI002A5A80B9|nr:FAD-linked oxidase C-terminal domain-containing protein [Tardiphaga sp. 42S5]WPO43237.1 FAD-linked oxidase C-terminal domain-containing protein [Tardiphaga sp. 42S5]